jgi:NAD(P)-dependent dehydrogenase (short-subunit alcohol dehydrogenase family)
MRVDLQERVALVTGAAQGIGKAIADLFAVNGAIVYYADLDIEKAGESASAWSDCAPLTMDVTQEEQVAAGMRRVQEERGRLDILVNNAGVNTLAHRVNIDAFPPSEWGRILSVDLTGVYLVSRAAVPLLRLSDAARIINIASVAGLVPLRLQCAFTAAKAGVINLTRAMALELGAEGILVNAIAPGSTLTRGTEKLFYGEDGVFKTSVQQMLAHIPLGRPGKPEEIAQAALFLAAPESSYITGHCLTVDGGWTAGYLREF